MVLIPAESDLPPFWIDRAEVSNAQYRAFLQSLPTNEAAALRPLWWPDPWEDRLDDLPVTGVSWRAARRYAAWAGKRLPTREEWDRAVGGDDDRAYPWGNDAGPPPCYANVGPGDGAAFLDVSADAPAESLARAINAYIANVQPVDAPTPRAGDDCPTSPEGLGRDRTPLGVMHLYANVEEWTASTPAPTDAFGDARYAYRVVKGFSWERRPGPGHPVRGLAEGQARVDSQILGTGFRCARSALVGGRAASIFTIEPDASARAAPAPGDRTHPL
jgi:formylglycine-generating enzyme required for sulfatase activity